MYNSIFDSYTFGSAQLDLSNFRTLEVLIFHILSFQIDHQLLRSPLIIFVHVLLLSLYLLLSQNVSQNFVYNLV